MLSCVLADWSGDLQTRFVPYSRDVLGIDLQRKLQDKEVLTDKENYHNSNLVRPWRVCLQLEYRRKILYYQIGHTL